MPVSQRDGDIPQRIQQLLDQRQEHQEAIEQIDQKLEQISGLLEIPRRGRRGRPPGRTSTAATSRGPGRPRGRRRGKVTAEESIREFVEQRGNPTTSEIKEHWRSQRRKGTPDNTLSKMVRERKLKRQPLEGQRGSRYALA